MCARVQQKTSNISFEFISFQMWQTSLSTNVRMSHICLLKGDLVHRFIFLPQQRTAQKLSTAALSWEVLSSAVKVSDLKRKCRLQPMYGHTFFRRATLYHCWFINPQNKHGNRVCTTWFAQYIQHLMFMFMCPKLLDAEKNKRKNEKAKGNNYFPAL